MEIKKAIDEITNRFGNESVMTSQFVNFIDDIGGFKNESVASKNIMKGLLESGFGELLYQLSEQKSENWQNLVQKCVNDYICKSGYQDSLVNHLATQLLLGMNIIEDGFQEIFQISTQAPTAVFKKHLSYFGVELYQDIDKTIEELVKNNLTYPESELSKVVRQFDTNFNPIVLESKNSVYRHMLQIYPDKFTNKVCKIMGILDYTPEAFSYKLNEFIGLFGDPSRVLEGTSYTWQMEQGKIWIVKNDQIMGWCFEDYTNVDE